MRAALLGRSLPPAGRGRESGTKATFPWRGRRQRRRRGPQWPGTCELWGKVVCGVAGGQESGLTQDSDGEGIALTHPPPQVWGLPGGGIKGPLMPRLQGAVRAAGSGAGDTGHSGGAARGGCISAKRRQRCGRSRGAGGGEPRARPRPDSSLLLQAPAPTRDSCGSWRDCCGRCTARIARSAAKAARPRCGNPAPACACCVSRSGPGMREWARLGAPERAGSEH